MRRSHQMADQAAAPRPKCPRRGPASESRCRDQSTPNAVARSAERRNLVKFVRGESEVVLQPHRLQPELSGLSVACHMDMRRFAPVARNSRRNWLTQYLSDRRSLTRQGHGHDQAASPCSALASGLARWRERLRYAELHNTISSCERDSVSGCHRLVPISRQGWSTRCGVQLWRCFQLSLSEAKGPRSTARVAGDQRQARAPCLSAMDGSSRTRSVRGVPRIVRRKTRGASGEQRG